VLHYHRIFYPKWSNYSKTVHTLVPPSYICELPHVGYTWSKHVAIKVYAHMNTWRQFNIDWLL